MIAVGFENHGGQTCNVKHPLGRVLSGYGNNFTEGIEGFYNGQVFGTYLHVLCCQKIQGSQIL